MHYCHADDFAVKKTLTLLHVAVTATGVNEAVVEVVDVDVDGPPIPSVIVGFDTSIFW